MKECAFGRMGVSMTTGAHGHRLAAGATGVGALITAAATVLAAFVPGGVKGAQDGSAAPSSSASVPPPIKLATPQPPLPPPPATGCRASCAGDDCPRFQIAAGMGLGELLGAARSFRQRLQLCPEVFVDTVDPMAP